MNSKIYLIFTLLISLFVSSASFATIEPYLDDDDEAVVYVNSSGTIFTSSNRVTTEINGDGSSESSAIEIYAPVNAEGDETQTNMMGGNMLASNGNIKILLDVTNSESDDMNLTAVFRDSSDSDWEVLYQAEFSGSSSDDDYSITFAGSSLWVNATGLAALENSTNDYDIYIFFTDEDNDYAVGQSLDDGDLDEGGLYYELNLSARDLASEDAPTLHYLIKGDGRLFADYTGNLISDGLKAVIISYDDTATVESNNENYADATAKGSIIDDDYDACSSSRTQITVSDLNNESPYSLGVACVDKYQFVTPFSTSLIESPESIDAFLEKNACYFISAGFGEEHYVLEYFRSFRDQVLLETPWGQKFVGWYYRTAPKYAKYVYKNSALSFVVQVGSYFLYFILNFWKLILILLPIIMLGMVFVLSRRNLNA